MYDIPKEELERLNNEGYSYWQIADKFGINESRTIANIFQRYGIKKKKALAKTYNNITSKTNRNPRKLKRGFSTIYDGD